MSDMDDIFKLDTDTDLTDIDGKKKKKKGKKDTIETPYGDFEL